MIAYALVSALSDTPVELFMEREDAEDALRDALNDEPGFVGLLSVAEVDVSWVSTPNSTFRSCSADEPPRSATNLRGVPM